jgi:hypothetical protein
MNENHNNTFLQFGKQTVKIPLGHRGGITAEIILKPVVFLKSQLLKNSMVSTKRIQAP